MSAGERYYNRDTTQNTNVDSDTPQTDKTFRSVQKKEIPVPTILAGDITGGVLKNITAYWLAVNECKETSGNWTGLNGTKFEEYLQDKTDSSAIATSFNDVRSKVLLLNEASTDYAVDFNTADIYEFLSYYTRYDNTSSLGNALAERVPYTYNSNGENGVYIKEYKTATLKSEYIVYVPDEAKDGRWNTKGGAPVVYLFGGGSQPSHLFFDISGWADVAKEHGLVIVVPCARVQPGDNSSGLNGDGGLVARWSQSAPAEEYKMILDIMEEVEDDFAQIINPNRVFGTGQSTGGGFVHYMAAQNSDLFTAFGASICFIFGVSKIDPGTKQSLIPSTKLLSIHDLRRNIN
jgi:hypothetical protein